MHPIRLTILPLLLAASLAHAADKAPAAPAVPAAPVTAPMTVLRVEHHLAALGADGVQRDVRFAERVYRQGGRVWIARELPAAPSTPIPITTARMPATSTSRPTPCRAGSSAAPTVR